MVAESIVKIGFPYAPRTMKEKGLPCCISDSRNNPIKGRVLIMIKFCNTLCCKGSLLLLIILSLLSNKRVWVMKNVPPVPDDLWHAVPIIKPLSRLAKKLINEIKAIVLNLVLCWLHIILEDMVLKLIFEIITYVSPKSVP